MIVSRLLKFMAGID